MSEPFSTALRERVTREVTAKVRREVTAKVRREVTAKVRREVTAKVWREAAKKIAAHMKDAGLTRRQIEEELAASWHVSRKEAARIADATLRSDD